MAPILHAPEIDDPALTWLNVAEPLSLTQLRGRVVVLDFWTMCCINCMHVMSTLKQVEEAFPEEVVVIGVHSPKFSAEKDVGAVRKAIARHGIEHPVIHDPDRKLWSQYAIRAWPTLIIIAPNGQLIGQVAGEPDPNGLLQSINQILDQSKQYGFFEPSALDLDPPREDSGALRFPGKIKPLVGMPRRWAVADGGHNQIAILDDDGDEIGRIGAGAAGFDDGAPDAARFNAPQGLVCAPDAIYVADTGNHAIRRIDLDASGAALGVTTLAGTGRRGGAMDDAIAEGQEIALASPWDLALDGHRLLVANAGTHQILSLDPLTGHLSRLAGTGGENLVDGAPREALLAQPSGLAIDADDRLLYVADAETSALRTVHLDSGAVSTLVGAGLVDFGHVNGALDEARLQHPLGVALDTSGRLVIADSYNHALRLVDSVAGRVDDLAAGADCADDACVPLNEPAGLWADGNRLLVSDTNNHRILAFDLAGNRYWTWAD